MDRNGAVAWALLAASLLAGPMLARSAEPDPAEIVRLTRSRHDAPYEAVQLSMTLSEADGTVRHRTLEIMARTGARRLQRAVVRFTGPRSMKGTALLTSENEAGDADQWLFLPILKRAKRIAVADRSLDFVGTDFSYEDMQPEQASAHAYAAAGSEPCDGGECWVIEARPRRRAGAGFDRRKLWIRKDCLFTVRIDYLDAGGSVLKRRTNADLVRVDERRWRADRVVMQSFSKKRTTTIAVSRRDLAGKIPDRVFTVEELERGI